MPPKRKRILRPDSPSAPEKEDLGMLSLSDGDSEGDKEESAVVVGLGDDDGQDPLLELDFSLHERSSWIRKLIQQPIADGSPFCHLRDIDIPGNATWSQSNTLSTRGTKPRAIVIVVFGSLVGFEMLLIRGKPTTLTVAIQLFAETEMKKLQQIYDFAHPGQVAPEEVIARRESAGSRSRLLNVYDRSGRVQPEHKLVHLSVNELLGGDVMRMEMRCVRVKDGEGYRVEFKLKTLNLFVPIHRGVDIMQ
ncbi:hypothetical protein GSI_08558 [Ganoderma sinense ZZ0214-1]|uniref:Uncharacterized protein n=1 Tax=Ganoderma sinense ZZ0214-1 TaxID=1077348 RepID=A0A2G8S423_9APHY|nr:hypothetical protein GSI_08558 [Ganoderma sinense ZZ0214-1]